MSRRDWTKSYDVDPDTGCWLWLGEIDAGGYGYWKPKQAHRRVYEIVVGPIPEGLELDHLCRVRRCVNPDHLEPVTHKENVLRGESFAAINARKTHCAQGHPYDERNTYWRTVGGRDCRTCNQAAVLRYEARKKEQKAAS